jgi:hypothetical protein
MFVFDLSVASLAGRGGGPLGLATSLDLSRFNIVDPESASDSDYRRTDADL